MTCGEPISDARECATNANRFGAQVLFRDDQAALRFVAGNDAALCTIIGIDGSFSRRLGAQLAIGCDGATVGSLADGCLERELASQAEIAREQGHPALLRYGKGSPFIDFRLPCGSGLDILVDPFPDRLAAGAAVEALDRRCEARLELPIQRSDLLGSRRYVPELRMLIFGDSAEAVALADLAMEFGVDIAVAGPQSGLSLDREPTGLVADRWSAIALLFHDHDWEAGILDWALAGPAFYIGAIGGRAAREMRETLLRQNGHTDLDLARLHSPVGLIPAAREAGTLALGVLAEIVRDYEALGG